MVNILAGQLAGCADHSIFADWTDRIAKGELPKHEADSVRRPRAQLVVTTWDWSDEKHYLHDLISTDRRNPTVNG